jgi:hypothetical protein
MTTKPPSEEQKPLQTYVELARLAHESFEQRRSYEWKMHFGFWGAIATIIFTAAKEKIVVFNSTLEATLLGIILFIAYFWHYWMVYSGHEIDKALKHYYAAKAEGLDEKRPDMPDSSQCAKCRKRFNWTMPYLIFTACLIYVALAFLLKIKSVG